MRGGQTRGGGWVAEKGRITLEGHVGQWEWNVINLG